MSLVTCCRDAMGLLTEHSEGALTGVTKVSMAFHMTVCPHCKGHRAQIETTVKVLGALPLEKPKTEEVEDILRLIASAGPESDP